MATNIIKILRSLTAGVRPSGRTYGEPYVNLSDNQLGVFDSGNVARDLLGVPFFSPAASYAYGQPVNQGGNLYIAQTNVAPGAFNPAQWSIATRKKNYVINGGMRISQQNGTNSSSATGYYAADQWFDYVSFTGGGLVSWGQVVSATPGGSQNRLRMIVATAEAVLPAGDFLMISQKFEGNRVADLKFGISGNKQIVIQFGCKGPAGTYGLTLRNAPTYNRFYIGTFTIAAGEANTDVIKSITLPADATGTWNKDTQASLEIMWTLAGGTTVQGAPNAWTAGNLYAPTGQFNFMGTANNVFELFDVGFYEGFVAPSFVLEDYAQELTACERYCQIIHWNAEGDGAIPTRIDSTTTFIQMRVPPSTIRLAIGLTTNIRNNDPTSYVICAPISNNTAALSVESAAAGTIQAMNVIDLLTARM